MEHQLKRDYLKTMGWRRADRAVGTNVSRELWIQPGTNRYGFTYSGVSLESAYKKQIKLDNLRKLYST